MKMLKMTVVALAVALLAPVAMAQDANSDVAGLYATAQAEGQTLPEFVGKITSLKTCNPKLAEKVIEFAIEQAKNDPALVEEVLRSVANSCVDDDTLTAFVVGLGIDPTVVTKVRQTQTAGGGGGPTPANPPGGPGVGGGGGSGSNTSSSN
ncbi:MAG: hypothetical protein J0M22_17480 [Gammaproteobacteria bacterium]|nr:hypothetical protein [Gammaproteobacteria bacterium]